MNSLRSHRNLRLELRVTSLSEVDAMKHFKIPALTVAALLTFVAACQADISVTVDEERQVTIVTSIGISEGLADFAGLSLEDLLGEALGGMDLDASGDVDNGDDSVGILGFLDGVGGNEVSRYSEDGYSGYRIAQSIPAEELAANSGDVEGIAAFADLVPGFEFRRTDADDGWIISGDAPVGSLVEDFVGGSDGDGFGGLFSLASDQIDATLRITLPGEIIESTAHRTENGTEVWDLLDSDGVTIRVVSGESVPFQAVPWIIAVIFALIVIAIIIWQVTTRRKRAATDAAPEPSQEDVILNIEDQVEHEDSGEESDTSNTADRNRG